MRRREFITLIGGAAATWPLAARAQQGERMRRVGVVMSVAADGPDGQPRVAAFLKGLQELGWTDRRNVRIDLRWGAGDAERTRNYVAELIALGPDVILASGDHPVVALQRATRAVRLCSPWSPIPLALALSRAWLTLAATRPDLPCTSTT
jgi:putative ABC transport system substrate-binding protein